MASFQRKLLPKEAQDTNTTTSSNTTTTVKTCLFFCSSQSNQTNPTFVCPEACLAICPSVCHYALEAFILPPEPSPPPNNPQNLSPLLISMLIILGSALFLITFYVLYTKLYSHFYNYSNSQIRYRRRRPSNTNTNITNDEEHGPAAVFHPIWYIPTVGLNPSVINSITVCKYGRREKDRVHVEGSDCAVCLAEFQQGDELRVLPKCNHAFHIPCIDTWLRSHTNCPFCRAPVVVAPHDQTPQNSSSRLASSEDHSPAQNSSSMDSNMRRSASTDCVENNKGNGGGGSCGGCSSQSQRWSHLERGAASFVSRSLSCSANIFSSRYNHNHNHNNNHNNSNSINNINNNDNNNNNNNNNDNGERRGPNSY